MQVCYLCNHRSFVTSTHMWMRITTMEYQVRSLRTLVENIPLQYPLWCVLSQP